MLDQAKDLVAILATFGAGLVVLVGWILSLRSKLDERPTRADLQAAKDDIAALKVGLEGRQVIAACNVCMGTIRTKLEEKANRDEFREFSGKMERQTIELTQIKTRLESLLEKLDDLKGQIAAG